MSYYFASDYFSGSVSSTNLVEAPFIRVATNSNGTNLVIQLTAPTDSSYQNSTLIWREVGQGNISSIRSTTLTSGSYTITNLVERKIYEIIALPTLDSGVKDKRVSNCLHAIPSSGSIREKITDRLQTQIEALLTKEIPDIAPLQIQVGRNQFRGKFRGHKGVVLITAPSISVVPYTTESRLVNYTIQIHVGWLDKRVDGTSEPEVGLLAENIRLTLDAAQDANIPSIIESEVTEIPFNSEVFDSLGADIIGFALEVVYQSQECITSV